jgi:hypothetical protein
MRFRFSLRWLLLATAIVAACCYWLVLPTIIAKRFVRAVASANYVRADACFADPNSRFLSKLNDKHWRFLARAELKSWSLTGSRLGNRLIQLGVSYGDAGPIRSFSFDVIVTRAGLLTPVPTMTSGGFGFGGLARTESHSHGTRL